MGLPEGFEPMITEEAIGAIGPVRYPHDETSPRIHVPSDPRRDFVPPAEFAEDAPASAEGLPTSPRGGRLRVICTRHHQPARWLAGLARADPVRVAGRAARAGRGSVRRHHVASSEPDADQRLRPAGAEPRVLAADVLELLHAHPNVVAWIAGHVHFHAALRHGATATHSSSSPRRRSSTGRSKGASWSSCACPTAAEVAIVSTVVDHRAPAAWSTDLDDLTNLASVSRALAANDYRMRESSLRGLTWSRRPRCATSSGVSRTPSP